VTCAVAIAVVRGFNQSFGPVRRVRLLKIYFMTIPMHVMIREIIPGK